MKTLRNDIDVQNLENLKPGTGVQVDDKTKYEYGANLETDGVPVIDEGYGKTIAIRVFTYKINPDKKKEVPKDKQILFNAHAKEIERFLWGDGLIPFDGASPRVIINLKKGFYQIFVPCEAKRGVMFMEKPKNLTQELVKEAKHGKLDPKSR